MKNKNFVGTVKIKNSKIFINTNKGIGYDKVLIALKDMIEYFCNKYKINNLSKDDMRQYIIMFVLESLSKYKSNKNTKLSTFVQMNVTRLLINFILNENKKANNATFLNLETFRVTCGCKNKYILTSEEIKSKLCDYCSKPLSLFKSHRISLSPISFSSPIHANISQTNGNILTIEDTISTENAEMLFLFNKSYIDDKKIITKYDLNKWLKSKNPKIKYIINEILNNDESILQIAKKMGVSHTWVKNKLLSSAKDKKLLEILK